MKRVKKVKKLVGVCKKGSKQTKKNIKEELDIKTGIGIDGSKVPVVICSYCGVEYTAYSEPSRCYACNAINYAPDLAISKNPLKVGSIPSGNKFDTSTRPVPFSAKSKFAVIPSDGVGSSKGVPDNTKDAVVRTDKDTPFSKASAMGAIPVGGLSRVEGVSKKRIVESDVVNRNVLVSFEIKVPMSGEVVLGSEGLVESVSEDFQKDIDDVCEAFENCEFEQDGKSIFGSCSCSEINLAESVNKKRVVEEKEGEEFDDKGEVEEFEDKEEDKEEGKEEDKEEGDEEEEEIEEPVDGIVVVNKEQFALVLDNLDIEKEERESIEEEAEEKFEEGEWIAFDYNLLVIVEGPSNDKEALVNDLEASEEKDSEEDEKDSEEGKKDSEEGEEKDIEDDELSEIPGDVVK